MRHNQLTDDMVEAILKLLDGRDGTLVVSTDKGTVVQAGVMQRASTSGRMAVTAVVERTQPLVVTVSATMPREAAALASLSALLPPMKIAERSGLVEGIPVEQDRSLEMSGQVSRASKKCVLSPSKRGLRSEASFSEARGCTEMGSPCQPWRVVSLLAKSFRVGGR
jgi:hypothetical protein